MTNFEYKKQIRKSLKEAHNFDKKKSRLNYQKFLYIIIEKSEYENDKTSGVKPRRFESPMQPNRRISAEMKRHS